MTIEIDTIKKLARVVVGTSVGYTVSNLIAHNTHTKKRRHKAEAYIGGSVVGWMAADATEGWTDRKIDELVAGYSKLKRNFDSLTK